MKAIICNCNYNKVLIICAILSFIILFLDSIDPLGVACGQLYPIVIFATLLAVNIKITILFALTSILFIVLGFFLSPDAGVPMWIVLINRGSSMRSIT
ncbi:MAG: hypothetical protein HQK76_15250 [Desulfobacterales bacterium]|nr:hypothetical protein [Desulfobacterales bacterium]